MSGVGLTSLHERSWIDKPVHKRIGLISLYVGGVGLTKLHEWSWFDKPT